MPELPTIEIDPEEMARIVGEMYDDLGPPGPSDPGLTTKEYATEWGLSPRRARKRIRALCEEGLLIKGQRWGRRSDNRWCPYPVYRPSSQKRKADDDIQ